MYTKFYIDSYQDSWPQEYSDWLNFVNSWRNYGILCFSNHEDEKLFRAGINNSKSSIKILLNKMIKSNLTTNLPRIIFPNQNHDSNNNFIWKSDLESAHLESLPKSVKLIFVGNSDREDQFDPPPTGREISLIQYAPSSENFKNTHSNLNPLYESETKTDEILNSFESLAHISNRITILDPYALNGINDSEKMTPKLLKQHGLFKFLKYLSTKKPEKSVTIYCGDPYTGKEGGDNLFTTIPILLNEVHRKQLFKTTSFLKEVVFKKISNPLHSRIIRFDNHTLVTLEKGVTDFHYSQTKNYIKHSFENFNPTKHSKMFKEISKNATKYNHHIMINIEGFHYSCTTHNPRFKNLQDPNSYQKCNFCDNSIDR